MGGVTGRRGDTDIGEVRRPMGQGRGLFFSQTRVMLGSGFWEMACLGGDCSG